MIPILSRLPQPPLLSPENTHGRLGRSRGHDNQPTVWPITIGWGPEDAMMSALILRSLD